MSTGGLSVAGAILELRVSTAPRTSSIPGVHNLPFWDVYSAVAPRIVGVRHEQAAGYAADAYYRTRGVSSAAVVTSGPGTANVVTAFGEAYISGSPVIVLASEVSMGHRVSAGPADSCTRWSTRARCSRRSARPHDRRAPGRRRSRRPSWPFATPGDPRRRATTSACRPTCSARSGRPPCRTCRDCRRRDATRTR